MKNFGKIISDKDIITKEYLDSKGYISAITSKMVTDALGFTPFDSAAFTKASIKNALGIADWALAANKPSYDDVYLKLTGGTITGNLTVNGKISGTTFGLSTSTASVSFLSNIFALNASLQIESGWVLRLAGEGITSWAGLKNYLNFAFSEIGSKPTTLAGYGITDAVKAGFRFDSLQTGAVNILGWVEAGNNWKGQGAGMVVGQTNYYSRINIIGAQNDPTMYISNIWAGTDYDWVKVLTEKNIGSHAIEVVNASTYPLPTDTRAFATYAYQRDGWKTAGPALAFAGGSYKGLIQMGVSDYAADSNSAMRMYIGGVRPDSEGGLQPWVEVLTEKNIGSFAMSLGQVTIGSDIDLNELLVPGAYNISGGPTNKPIGVGDGSLLVVGGKDKYFMSQYMVGYNNNLYYRLKEGISWKDWRIVITDGNIGDYAISKAGGTINGNITLNSLYVKGSIYFGSKLAFAGGTNWFSFGEQYMNDGDTVYINGKSLYFRASATTDLVILSSGNIGIGTASPSSKLHVNGLITAGGGINLGGETITSWDDLKASGDYLPLTGGTITGVLSVTGALTVNGGIAMNDGTVYTSWNDIRAMNAYVWAGASQSVPLTPNEKIRLQGGITGTWTITLGEPDADRPMVKFYYLEFTTGATVPTINFSKTLKWKDGKTLQANMQANKTYRLLIDNNLASWEVYY